MSDRDFWGEHLGERIRFVYPRGGRAGEARNAIVRTPGEDRMLVWDESKQSEATYH